MAQTMILDFNAMNAVPVERLKDGEGTLMMRKFEDAHMGSVVHLTMPPHTSIGLHTHVGNCEIVYILAGNGECLYDDTVYPVEAGMVLYCPEHHTHSMRNISDGELVLLGILPNSAT